MITYRRGCLLQLVCANIKKGPRPPPRKYSGARPPSSARARTPRRSTTPYGSAHTLTMNRRLATALRAVRLLGRVFDDRRRRRRAARVAVRAPRRALALLVAVGRAAAAEAAKPHAVSTACRTAARLDQSSQRGQPGRRARDAHPLVRAPRGALARRGAVKVALSARARERRGGRGAGRAGRRHRVRRVARGNGLGDTLARGGT